MQEQIKDNSEASERLRGPSQIELSLRDRKRRMTEAESAEGGEEVISGGE